jgi:hypothetical protein
MPDGKPLTTEEALKKLIKETDTNRGGFFWPGSDFRWRRAILRIATQ